MGTPERICHVAQRILETQRQGCRVVAVVSAMAGVTDELLRLGHGVAPEPTKRELDILLSTGEQMDLVETILNLRNIRPEMPVIVLVDPASSEPNAAARSIIARAIPEIAIFTLSEFQAHLNSTK